MGCAIRSPSKFYLLRVFLLGSSCIACMIKHGDMFYSGSARSGKAASDGIALNVLRGLTAGAACG